MEESYCWGQLGYAPELPEEDEDEEVQQGEEEGTPLHGAPHPP